MLLSLTSIWPVGFLWKNQYIWTVSIHIYMCVGAVEYTHICTLKTIHIKLAVSYIQYVPLFNVWIMSSKQTHSLIATHQHISFRIIGGTNTILYVVPWVANGVYIYNIRNIATGHTCTLYFHLWGRHLKRMYPYHPAGVSSLLFILRFRLRNGSHRTIYKHPRYPRSVSVKHIERRLEQSRGTLLPILQNIEQFAAPS
jgi:hypothetical protein